MKKSSAKRERKAKWFKDFEEVADILVARDFTVKQYSEHHFRIKNAEGLNEIDVWPTTQRYYVPGTDNKGYYKGVDGLIEIARTVFPQPHQ